MQAMMTLPKNQIEDGLFGDFLSEDPVKVARIAAEAGPFLVALAGAPLDVRRSVAEEWRAKQIADEIALPGWLADSLRLLPADYLADALAGKVGIAAFTEAARKAHDNNLVDRRECRVAGKARVREHLTQMHKAGDRPRQSAVPRAAVVTEAGELSWHRSEQGAKKHGRESGGCYVVMPVDWGRARFFQKADLNAPDDGAGEDVEEVSEGGSSKGADDS